MYYMCKLYVHITGTCILSYTAACVGTVIKPTRKKTEMVSLYSCQVNTCTYNIPLHSCHSHNIIFETKD